MTGGGNKRQVKGRLMTPFQQELLLRFKGREHPFVAPKLASYEEHEEWRRGELAGLEGLAEEGSGSGVRRTAPGMVNVIGCRLP